MPEPITLPVHCAECGGAVTLQMSDWPNAYDMRLQTWTCPYCDTKNEGAFPARLVRVTKGHKSHPDAA